MTVTIRAIAIHPAASADEQRPAQQRAATDLHNIQPRAGDHTVPHLSQNAPLPWRVSVVHGCLASTGAHPVTRGKAAPHEPTTRELLGQLDSTKLSGVVSHHEETARTSYDRLSQRRVRDALLTLQSVGSVNTRGAIGHGHESAATKN